MTRRRRPDGRVFPGSGVRERISPPRFLSPVLMFGHTRLAELASLAASTRALVVVVVGGGGVGL